MPRHPNPVAQWRACFMELDSKDSDEEFRYTLVLLLISAEEATARIYSCGQQLWPHFVALRQVRGACSAQQCICRSFSGVRHPIFSWEG